MTDSPTPPQPQDRSTPPKKRHYLLDPQLVVAIAVVVISVCALFVSLMQARIMNKQYQIMEDQSKASVWPRLEVSVNVGRDPISKVNTLNAIMVRNQGVGPAIVEGIRVKAKGRYVKNWNELFQVLQKPDSIQTFLGTQTLNHKVITATETIKWLDIKSNSLPLMFFLHQHAQNISIEICYRSVFKDYWIVTRKGVAGGEEPTYRQVDACTFAKAERFLD